MIRSLGIGVSGLRSNQTRLDVVGNNIANANTVAYKRGRAAFSEVLGQQQLGVGRNAGGSGINPSHVGLGVNVNSIDQNWQQGSLNNTGIQTDLALSGDGFFVARSESQNGNEQMLTRAGNFTFNENGEFVTANGMKVQGWGFDANGQTGQIGDIQIDPNAQSPAQFTGEATVGGNLTADAEEGDTSSVSSVVYDAQGNAHEVVVSFEKTANNNEWNYSVEYGGDGPSPFPDQNGAGTDGLIDGTVTFDVDGENPVFTQSDNPAGDPPVLDWGPNFVGGGESLDLDLDGVTQYSGSTTTKFQSQDGHAAGELAGYSINPEGILELSFTNGEQEQAAQLAIGNVNNPNGLEQQGENFYTATSTSGDLQLGRAGRDLRTSVVSGALESSNVDIATEFTEMITAQRGYQASARVVTTSDELLQETMQLKR